MNILNKKIAVIALIAIGALGLMSCGGEGANKKAKTGKPIPTYMATSLDCEFQKNIKLSERKKLLVFDPTGIFPEELYAGSPSNKIRREILEQPEFKEKLGKMCDLFFVTQDCPDSATLTKELKVTNFPTFMVVDKTGRILYKKEKLTSLQDLHEDIRMLF